jgi:hypothetical protein
MGFSKFAHSDHGADDFIRLLCHSFVFLSYLKLIVECVGQFAKNLPAMTIPNQ